MSDQIKITFIEQDTGIGGAEVNLFYLFERMNRDRFHPIVVVPYEGPLTERLEEMGVEHRIIRQVKFISTSTYVFGKKIFNPFAVLFDIMIFLPTIWRIRSFLKKEEINIVQTNSMVAHIYGAIAARLAGVPCIWHMQDIVDPKMALGLVRKTLVYIAAVMPDRIVAVSKAVGRMFTGRSAAKVRIVYNGTDTERFSPNVDGSVVRREFNIADDYPVIGMIGRLVYWKGHQEFLKAISMVKKELNDVRALIVGDTTFGNSEYKDELVQMANRLGIAKNVIFAGHRSDISRVLRAMDIMVHASITPEPFGLVIVEAMASGIPVIAAKSGGPLEIIEHGKDGFLIDPHSSKDLVKGIIEILKNEDMKANFAKSGREKIKKKFYINNFIAGFEQVYSKASNISL